MYSIGTINEMMSYISTMISYALLCIRVAEVVYSRYQKWKDITGARSLGPRRRRKFTAQNCTSDGMSDGIRRVSPNVSFVVEQYLGLEVDRSLT